MLRKGLSFKNSDTRTAEMVLRRITFFSITKGKPKEHSYTRET